MYNSSIKNMRRPNILRRKPKQVPTDNVNLVKKSQQSLSKDFVTHNENISSVKNMRRPNILRRKPKQVHTDNVNLAKKSQQSLLKDLVKHNENISSVKSSPKTLPRVRNPPQRIVLDSYLSSKNRIIKNDKEAIVVNNFLSTENSYILLEDNNQTYYIEADNSVQNIFTLQYDTVRAAEDVLAQVELENPPQIIQHDQTDDSDLANFLNDGENVNIYEEIHQDLSENKTPGKSSHDESTNCEIIGPYYRQRLVAEALETVGIKDENLFFVQASNGSKSWVCPNDGCDITFKTQYLLKNHILTHYDLRPFKCSYDGCSKAFRFMSKLRIHFQTHFSVKRKSLLKTSVDNNVNLEKKIRCPAKDCKSVFNNRSELSTHLSNSHRPDEAIHKCSICEKRFWSVSGLMTHIKAHSHTPGELTCLWPGCGLKFSLSSRLKYHTRCHTGDKPYKCTFPMCTWAFASASKLRRHSLAHSTSRERRHVCEICGRGFTRPQHLREHLPRHTPHRPHSFACDYPGCEDKFSNKSSVYMHKKREHTAEGKLKSSKSKKGHRGKHSLKTVEIETTESVKVDSGSARTHVPWDTKDQISAITTTMEDILPQTINCDENQGNPLVCGGLELEGDNGGVVSALTLEVESVVGSALPELGPDILGTSVDNINSLLQEELTDGMLYTTEDDAALRVLLLSGDQGP